MSKTENTKKIIDLFYQRLLKDNDTDGVIGLFAEKVDWDLPGDKNIACWIGKRHSKDGIKEFFRQLSENVEPVSFNLEKILVDECSAVGFGKLASRMLATGKVFESIFTAIFHVENNKIIRYYFLEDSAGLVKSLQ